MQNYIFNLIHPKKDKQYLIFYVGFNFCYEVTQNDGAKVRNNSKKPPKTECRMYEHPVLLYEMRFLGSL